MNKWNIISKSDCDFSRIKSDGIKFIIGNGFMGYRGTLDEMEKNDFVGLNLPNFYDRVGDDWTDSVNAFNPLYTIVEVEGIQLKQMIKHYQELDISTGIFSRKSVFLYNDIEITITSERFISMTDYNYLGLVYSVKANKDIDLTIKTGIDTDIWSIHGNHFKEISFDLDNDIVRGITTQYEDNVIVAEKVIISEKAEKIIENNKLLNVINLSLKKNKSFSFKKVSYINYKTDKDVTFIDYNILLKKHLIQMKKTWKFNYLYIKGEFRALQGINYSIYQLLISAPYHANNLSIPARGLSSQVYKGAIFWDTEIFMLPFFLNTNLNIARSIIQYRIDSLSEAKKKATEFNHEGAFYAWESIKDGVDACSLYNVTDAITNQPIRTYFKDKQIHISGDCIYGLSEYYSRTKDHTIILNGGLEMVFEVTKFYLSCVSLENEKYVIKDVIGPDEYHERVDNNAYTNMIVLFTLEKCLEYYELIKRINNEVLEETLKKCHLNLELVKKVKANLFIYQIKNNIIEQFSGYFDLIDTNYLDFKKGLKEIDKKSYLGGKDGLVTPTQIIKQADVITMLYLFKSRFTKEEMQANFDYYEPRTEHGSSLSASMYSLVASIIGLPEYAYPFFLKSSEVDLQGDGKEYAGGVYIGGSHMASCGGAYMSLIYGFCGLRIDNQITINPHLPQEIKKVRFNIIFNNKKYLIKVTNKNKVISKDIWSMK